MRNPSSTRNRGFIQLWPRRVIRTLLCVGLLLLAALLILYFCQHSMVYHPRPYDESYAYAFPANGVEINYTVATVKYCRAGFCNASSCAKRCSDFAVHNAARGSSHDV